MRSFSFDDVASGDSGWLLEVDGFDARVEASIEAVFALVNGYQGTRAAMEEGGAGTRAATLIAGVFNVPERPQGPELESPISELVVGPEWSRVQVMVGGESLCFAGGDAGVVLVEQRRVLDMRRGVLVRRWRVRDGSGRVTRLESLRCASLADRHVLVQVVWVTPENYGGEVVVTGVVDGRVTNEGGVVHLVPEGVEVLDGGACLQVRTTQSRVVVAVATYAQFSDAAGAVVDGVLTVGPGVVEQRWVWQAEPGQTGVLQKVVTLATSRECADAGADAMARLGGVLPLDVGALLAASAQAWAQWWARADVVIAGDVVMQRQVRFALYHLMGAAWSGDERVSVGARALTGERYRGHVFWDTESFVWPFYALTDGATARALLLYRYHTLDAARAKARAMGFRGALFAWESTDTGEETTPPFIIIPGIGRQAVLTGVEEHHVAADVAYAFVQDRQVRGDDGFFFAFGAEVVLEVARFWASRARREGDGWFHIRGVIGPDEYHESVDDNAYTNVLARWVLRRGVALVEELRQVRPDVWGVLAQRCALTVEEVGLWREVADGLVVGFDAASGVFEQFAGFYGLRAVDVRGHDSAAGTIDVQVGWGALQQTQVLKQADVVMLVFLLWEELPPEVRAANFRFYEPRTAHDSSLSPAMHALVAARLGDVALAERYVQRALRIDLDFAREGWAGASGGVHIAALGGVWQALVFGFLGVRPQDAGVRFEPHVPLHWGRLEVPLVWRGCCLRATVDVGAGVLEVVVESGGPLAVALGDGGWEVATLGVPWRVGL